MDWEQFVEGGLIGPAPEAKARSMPLLNEAWDAAIRARRQCVEHEYAASDRSIREAMTIATDSLCQYFGYRFVKPATFDDAQLVCSAYFNPGIADGVFERARILGGMLPLPEIELEEDLNNRVRHSVGASAELCAMVEAFVYFQ